jgi:adenine-specific DNA glycosylase
VARQCRALALDSVEAFPESPPRPALTEERRAVAVIARRGQLLMLRAAPEAVRWAGMWQFPDLKLAADEPAVTRLPQAIAESTGVEIALGEHFYSLEHHVTRFRIQIEVYRAQAVSGRARARDGSELRWCAPHLLSTLAMPLSHRKIARALTASEESGT